MKLIVRVLVFGEIGLSRCVLWAFEGGRKRNVTNFVVKHVRHAGRPFCVCFRVVLVIVRNVNGFPSRALVRQKKNGKKDPKI